MTDLIDPDPVLVGRAARAAYEAIRAWMTFSGEENPSWDAATVEMRTNYVMGVRQLLGGWTPEMQYAAWREKHPDACSYEAVPREQQAKDRLFVAVVRGVFGIKG